MHAVRALRSATYPHTTHPRFWLGLCLHRAPEGLRGLAGRARVRRAEALWPPWSHGPLPGVAAICHAVFHMLGARARRNKEMNEHGPPLWRRGAGGQVGLRCQVMLAPATQDGGSLKGLRGARLRALKPLWLHCALGAVRARKAPAELRGGGAQGGRGRVAWREGKC